MTAFPSRPGCPIPEVEKIPHDLVRDCVVPVPPDPFFEGFTFPPIPVPAPIGCAKIEIEKKDTSFSTAPFTLPAPKPELEVGVSYRDGDQCFPSLEFDLAIPCICTDITVAKADVALTDNPIPEAIITIEPKNPPELNPDLCDCQLEFKFDLKIPEACTSIEINTGSELVAPAGVGLVFESSPSETDPCVYDINLGLVIPDFCKETSAGEVSGTVTINETTTVPVSGTTSKSDTSNCGVDATVNIDLSSLVPTITYEGTGDCIIGIAMGSGAEIVVTWGDCPPATYC